MKRIEFRLEDQEFEELEKIASPLPLASFVAGTMRDVIEQKTGINFNKVKEEYVQRKKETDTNQIFEARIKLLHERERLRVERERQKFENSLKLIEERNKLRSMRLRQNEYGEDSLNKELEMQDSNVIESKHSDPIFKDDGTITFPGGISIEEFTRLAKERRESLNEEISKQVNF